MKLTESRNIDVFYCDICGEECGLPYHGYDTIGYGSCCSGLMRKIETAGIVEELREKIPQFGRFFEDLEKVKHEMRMKQPY